ncbi:polysaccharide pyruvyl transferase family protein [Rhizobium leucaenae]|uniref:polysaccharide pyruvyl transferase family protein n=1 Tax=Rhizobium leucaenae TaxID=29450 RepID=UPI000400F207|nr:polysaccharide pyruvyl transferase family protein [Rhizobium leucaenae]
MLDLIRFSHRLPQYLDKAPIPQSAGRDRVGVLTFHRCINYGSYWQARCLIEGLEMMGLNAVLLEHRSARVDRAEWRCALQPLLPIPTRRDDLPLYKMKIRRFFDAFAALPLSAPFPLERPADAEEFPLVIVGSDEVWNLRHPWYGGYGAFYGEGLRSGRLVSYAATFGNFDSLDRLREPWADSLRRFSQISVRDLNSKRLIKDALGLDAELVLDPCLQFPEAIWNVGKEEKGSAYLAVYGHSFPGWFQNAVRRWADARSITLISIGYRNDWADEQSLDAGPEDFARFMAGAAAVVTNFFHGCVFSLVNDKPFACVLSDYRSNKLLDLTAMVGAERNVISEESPSLHLDAALGEPPGSAISQRITALRRNSSAYLQHVVQYTP